MARAHIDALEARTRVGRAAPRARGAGLRVVAAGTVMANGPIPAPLVDASWRARPPRLDECLDAAVSRGALAPRETLRLGVEATLDAHGAATEVAVKSPPALEHALAQCVENAVQTGLRVARPRRAAPTRIRVELLVGPAPAPAGT
jgi:hypothetical protein